MKSNPENYDRVECLNSEINDQYAKLSAARLNRQLSDYPEVVTEMVEITAKGRELCRAMHVFDEIHFERVRFPPEIHQHLEVGDVFLITMGRSYEDWHVCFSSPKYETETVNFEDDLLPEEMH